MLHCTSLVFSQVSPFMWVKIDYYSCRPRPGFSRFIISTLSSTANALLGVVSLANRRQDYNQCESILLRKQSPQRQSRLSPQKESNLKNRNHMLYVFLIEENRVLSPQFSCHAL
ncbi:hypothetical protein TorRG33x02_238150 [Trema orientale]|uniref:Uncharacterized protein n=1 Tax=Trema orientale TaxID=63057 RepID=A0A2P5DYY3_TREOI|nr:hypothetical protein TorRG33x02_238150 [Trema orientale]